MHKGTVPDSFCSLTMLSVLSFTFASSNPLLSCAPSCLSTIATSYFPPVVAAVCPNGQNNAICGFIAATNIASLPGYNEWACNSNGFTSTDPCQAGSWWDGLDCSAGLVDEINIYNEGLTGNTSYADVWKLFSVPLHQ